MEYQPKTDQELEAEFLLAPGTYSGFVMEAEERVDKKSRPFFMVKLCVYDSENHEHHIYDNISPHWFHNRFKHFFSSAGRLDLYQTGKATAEVLLNLNVTAIVDQQQDPGYSLKNIVTDYVVSEKPSAAVQAEVAKDDGLPF